MKRIYSLLLLALTLVAGFSNAAEIVSPPKSLLVISTFVSGADFFEMPVIQKLLQDGWNIKPCDITEVSEALLNQFQVVLVTDVSRLDERAARFDSLSATKAQLESLGKIFTDYVTKGGNLWIFGRSTHHMGSPWAVNALNVLLKLWDAEVLDEMIRDSKNERVQTRYMKFRYGFTNNISRDPLTTGMNGLWYPNQIMVGITAALKTGGDWKPLIRGMKSSSTTRIISDNGYPFEVKDPGTVKNVPVMAAVRSLGDGRVLLTGWGGTIPFFGLGHLVWDDIMPSQGLGKTKSDWLTFFKTSLNVLAAGSKKVGGYTGKPVERQEPPLTVIKDWSAIKIGIPSQSLFRGVIGASTFLSDGTGTVADFCREARKLGLHFVVFTEDLKSISEAGYRNLVSQCQAETTREFAAIPGLKYMEINQNYKIIVGPSCWPSDKKLHLPDRTIFDSVFFWFDSGAPLHLYYNLHKNNYPSYAYRGYNALGVLTYDEGKLIDEAVSAYLDNNHHGDLLTPLVVNLTRSPEALKNVTFWYYVPAYQLTDWVKEAGREYGRYGGWAQGFISSGPRILQWESFLGHRFTAGRWYVPGTERWRVALKVASDIPLKTVEILENQQVIRTYRPSGKTFDLELDEVHDRQKVLVARVTDIEGNWALTGGITIDDGLYRQFLCSDRQNFMGGQQDTRDEKDRYITIQATAMLDKNTRAGVGNAQTSDSRTLNPYGVDGGFGNTFGMYTPMMIRGKTWSEFRFPTFHNGFRYCSRDAIIYDLHYTHRMARDGNPWPNLDDPWQFLEPQQYFQSTVTSYNFPHFVSGVSPTLVDFEMKFDRKVALSKVCNPDQGRWAFWTHRLGFHHPEFRFKKMLKGVPGWDEAPTNLYSDNFPPLLLAANEGEADLGVEDHCAIVFPDGKTTTLQAGPDAAHPNSWQGTLKPGAYLTLFPNLGGSGGFFVVDGEIQSRVELGYDWKRIFNGLYDLRSFAAGDIYKTRLLLFQNKPRETDPIKDWSKFRDTFGVKDGAPLYAPKLTRGQLLGSRYLLDLQADQGSVLINIGQADLGQRLPIRITHLSDHCTAALANNTRKEWLPIGIVGDEAFATLDTRLGPSELFLGNLVTSNSPDLWCTVLPEGDRFIVDVHNPTDRTIRATLTVPEGLWMLRAGTHEVEVLPGTTARIGWIK